jgi:hypothetical protein
MECSVVVPEPQWRPGAKAQRKPAFQTEVCTERAPDSAAVAENDQMCDKRVQGSLPQTVVMIVRECQREALAKDVPDDQGSGLHPGID